VLELKVSATPELGVGIDRGRDLGKLLGLVVEIPLAAELGPVLLAGALALDLKGAGGGGGRLARHAEASALLLQEGLDLPEARRVASSTAERDVHRLAAHCVRPW